MLGNLSTLAARGVHPYRLTLRLRQPVVATRPGEVDLTQRVSALLDVLHRSNQGRVMAGSRCADERRPQ